MKWKIFFRLMNLTNRKDFKAFGRDRQIYRFSTNISLSYCIGTSYQKPDSERVVSRNFWICVPSIRTLYATLLFIRILHLPIHNDSIFTRCRHNNRITISRRAVSKIAARKSVCFVATNSE